VVLPLVRHNRRYRGVIITASHASRASLQRFRFFLSLQAQYPGMFDVEAATGQVQSPRRRRWIALPVALLCVLGACFGYLFATAEVKPNAQLG
jgi:hypothetical protein